MQILAEIRLSCNQKQAQQGNLLCLFLYLTL